MCAEAIVERSLKGMNGGSAHAMCVQPYMSAPGAHMDIQAMHSYSLLMWHMRSLLMFGDYPARPLNMVVCLYRHCHGG